MGQIEWASFVVLLLYLAWFLGGTALAARKAGKRLWLLDLAAGRQLAAAWGFRLAFVLVLLWPLALIVVPQITSADPLAAWSKGSKLDLPGHLLLVSGVMLAAAAQLHMGASWRVGVSQDAVGNLVTDGPFALSRNPVFLGQLLIFLGLLVVWPAIATAVAVILYWLSAELQARAEEQALASGIGVPYLEYHAQVGHWIGRRRGNSSARFHRRSRRRLQIESRSSTGSGQVRWH